MSESATAQATREAIRAEKAALRSERAAANAVAAVSAQVDGAVSTATSSATAAAASAASAAADASRAETTVDDAVANFLAAPVMISGATAITAEAHGNRILYVLPGGSLSASWANTGHGFSCHILNRSGATITLSFSGFDAAPVNVFSAAGLVDSGVAVLMVVELPDDTREAWLTGDVSI